MQFTVLLARGVTELVIYCKGSVLIMPDSFGGIVKDHRNFLRFKGLKAEVLNPAALKIFLTGWLMEHSSISDSMYVKWIMKCRADSVGGEV